MLMEKMTNLLKLQKIRFKTLALAEFYVFFNAFSEEILETAKLSQLMLVKNFIFYVVSNLSVLNFFSAFPNYIINLKADETDLSLTLKLYDGSSFGSINRIDSADLFDNLYDTEINDLEDEAFQEVDLTDFDIDIDEEFCYFFDLDV